MKKGEYVKRYTPAYVEHCANGRAIRGEHIVFNRNGDTVASCLKHDDAHRLAKVMHEATKDKNGTIKPV